MKNQNNTAKRYAAYLKQINNYAIGKLSNKRYAIDKKHQKIIDMVEDLAEKEYSKAKENETETYQNARFEIWHNHQYDKPTPEEFEALVKEEFIYNYAEPLIYEVLRRLEEE